MPGEVPPAGHIAVAVALVGQDDVEACGLPGNFLRGHRPGTLNGRCSFGVLLHFVRQFPVEIARDMTADGLQRTTGEGVTIRDPTLPLALETPRPEMLGGRVDVAGCDSQAQSSFDALGGLL